MSNTQNLNYGYTFVNAVDSIDDLRLIRPDFNGQVYIVSGRNIIGDGDGATYVWSDTSNAVDDDINVISSQYSGSLGKWLIVDAANNIGSQINTLKAQYASASGASLIGYGNTTVSNQLDMISDDFVTLEMFGAKGDGTTDDTAAFTSACAHFPNGGIVKGTNGNSYYFPNGITIPEGIKFIGSTIPVSPKYVPPAPGKFASTIIIPSTVTITLDNQSEISNWMIWRDGLVLPDSTQVTDEAGLAVAASFAGIAITSTKYDPVISNNLILGFNTAILLSGSFRPKVSNNHMDCTSGIEATGIADAGEGCGIWSNRCMSYCLANLPYSWKVTYRSGVAFNFHDQADGLNCYGNFSYGYRIGLRLSNVYSVKGSFWIDGFSLNDPTSAAGCVGIQTEGDVNFCKIDAHIDGQDTGFNMTHTSGQFIIGPSTCGVSTNSHIVLGANSSGHIVSLGTSGNTSQYAVTVLSGVGIWNGEIQVYDTAAVQNSAIYCADNDRENIANLKIDSVYGLTNTLASGAAWMPALRINPQENVGFYLDPSNPNNIGIGSGGVTGALFITETGATNYPFMQSQTTGNSVIMGASGSDANINLQVQAQGTGTVNITNHLMPLVTSTNPVLNLGSSDDLWGTVYARNGVVQTSDPALKNNIVNIDGDTAVKLVEDINPITFEWKDNPDGTHYGFNAQNVMDVLKANNLDTTSIIDDSGEHMVIHVDQMSAILWAAVQTLLKK